MVSLNQSQIKKAINNAIIAANGEAKDRKLQ